MKTTKKYGFDNEKYLKIQSEHIKDRIAKFGTNCISNSAANSSTISMPAVCCQASSLIVN